MNFENTPEISSLPFPIQGKGENTLETTFIGEISTKFLLGPRCFLIVHSSSSNMFFKIAKRAFEGREEIVKFVRGSGICFA